MTDNYLLKTELSRRLYESVRRLPIIDYHNHLELKPGYANITELWIASDPYKHRLMRISGVDEYYITGKASDREKFDKFCEIFPMLVGTPVYDWCLMELAFFGIDEIPSSANSAALWERLNRELEGLDTLTLLRKFNVEYVSPVASVLDDVSVYTKLDGFAPSLRGDDAVDPDRDFVKKLSKLTGMKIRSLDDYFAALLKRLEAFESVGCRFADHALDDEFGYITDDGKNAKRFEALLDGDDFFGFDRAALNSHILRTLGAEYGRRGITMQLHFGAMRKTSTRLRVLAGKAGGYAAIGSVDITEIVRLLDDIQRETLPSTILFPLNPAQLEESAVLSGSFSKDGVPAVISTGPAWWWDDHRNGIRRTLDAIADYSVLSTFVGMTTDSRSPLSFVRHDYFRRIACSWLADKYEGGEFICAESTLAVILKKICYENARAMLEKGKRL